jgi:hypothetical protein
LQIHAKFDGTLLQVIAFQFQLMLQLIRMTFELTAKGMGKKVDDKVYLDRDQFEN